MTCSVLHVIGQVNNTLVSHNAIILPCCHNITSCMSCELRSCLATLAQSAEDSRAEQGIHDCLVRLVSAMQEPVADNAMKQGPPSPNIAVVGAAFSSKVCWSATDLLLTFSPLRGLPSDMLWQETTAVGICLPLTSFKHRMHYSVYCVLYIHHNSATPY